MRHSILSIIGVQLDTTEHKEKLISGLGGFVSILLIILVSSQFITSHNAALIIASMGASSVLLFAVPHGPLSQPWPVAGGHIISAAIGVSCFILIPNQQIAAAIAVGLSIVVMYYSRCIHPPGGATALVAVIGGADVHELGYSFIVTPVLFNVVIILLTAFLFNYLFDWRRFPVAIAKQYQPVSKASTGKNQFGLIPKVDLEYALHAMKSFADISEIELERIFHNARQHQRDRHLSPQDIKLGRYYLHGEKSGNGVIKRVIDESEDDKDMIIYKIITGLERKKTQVTTREKFSRWAKHEVIFNQGHWEIK